MAVDFESKYSGEQTEALLDQVANGEIGGGIEAETDPIFSASPAASITEADKSAWSSKQDAISDLANIRDGASKGATALQAEDIADFVTAEDLAAVATSGSYNDLSFKPTFKTINGESILGSGDITISGGSGEVGPQGPQGDKGDKGDTGVGVQSVAQTTTSNADGGSNVVTVTLTDGTTSTFTVKNGSKGSQGIQGVQGPKGDTGANGTNGKDGADGADGTTFTPSVDSAGNLSWTNNKGLTNPPTVNIKGPKGDKGDAGEGGGGSSGGGGVETISLSGGFGTPLIIDEMLAEKRYWLYVDGGLDGNEESIVIGGFEGDGVVDGEHIRHFYAVIECVSNNEDVFNVSLSLPDVDICWSTGIPIPIRGNGRYELSIAQACDAGYAYYNAVLTSFS